MTPVQASAEARFSFLSPENLESVVGSDVNLTIQSTAIREDANCTYQLFMSTNSMLTDPLYLPRLSEDIFSTTLHVEEPGDYKVRVRCVRTDHPSVEAFSLTSMFSVDFDCLQGESTCENSILSVCENGFFVEEQCPAGCDETGLACAPVQQVNDELDLGEEVTNESLLTSEDELTVITSEKPAWLQWVGVVLIVIAIYLFVMWFLHRRPKGE